jgi:phage tail sheath protein FI
VDQGLRSRFRPERVRPAEWSHGGHLGPQRRHARRAQGAGQRGRPRRHRPRGQHHEGGARSPQSGRINCIRSFPGRGIRVWGARTISSDPSWRYLNVRRLFNYIEESILEGTQWVVFEPNDLDLWQRIKRTINAFLLGVWRDGALFGATPEQAFYVKCDSETNPPDVVDRGQVICEIGIAPVKPAEFVVFRLAQFSGGADLAE